MAEQHDQANFSDDSEDLSANEEGGPALISSESELSGLEEFGQVLAIEPYRFEPEGDLEVEVNNGANGNADQNPDPEAEDRLNNMDWLVVL